MKKTLALPLLVTAALAMSACGGSAESADGPQAQATVTVTATPTAEATPSNESSTSTDTDTTEGPDEVEANVSSGYEDEDAADDDAVSELSAEIANGQAEDKIAKVGDVATLWVWKVKILDVNKDAWPVLKTVNPYNEPPKGQYVLVTWEATYTGTERDAVAISDLLWSFTDPDNNVHSESAVVTQADEESWQAIARPGGTVKYQSAIDVPRGKVDGGLISVEGYDGHMNNIYVDFQGF